MGTIIDYLKTHDQDDFITHPLNELDCAIINELGYLPLGESGFSIPFRFSEVSSQIESLLADVSYSFLVTKERVELLKSVLQAPRFESLTLVRYTNRINVDVEQQFAAMVFELSDASHCQVVFRGTDDSLVGWKEDFNMAYMREIPAQRSSVAFLREVLARSSQALVVSGHSKGGNLAVYAASHQEAKEQEKIEMLYLFDAPGLHASVLNTAGYQRIRDRIQVIRPYESVVGVMLANDLEVIIVNSDKAGIEQHNLNYWQVADTQFERLPEPSPLSQTLETTFRLWMAELSRQELKLLFDTIFDLFWETGIHSLDDFQDTPYKKLADVMASLSQLPPEKHQLIGKSLASLVGIYLQERYKALPKWTPDHLFDWLQHRR